MTDDELHKWRKAQALDEARWAEATKAWPRDESGALLNGGEYCRAEIVADYRRKVVEGWEPPADPAVELLAKLRPGIANGFEDHALDLIRRALAPLAEIEEMFSQICGMNWWVRYPNSTLADAIKYNLTATKEMFDALASKEVSEAEIEAKATVLYEREEGSYVKDIADGIRWAVERMGGKIVP